MRGDLLHGEEEAVPCLDTDATFECELIAFAAECCTDASHWSLRQLNKRMMVRGASSHN